MDLVVLVTGAAGRLGSEFSKAICKAGGKVVLVDVNKDNLTRLCKELPSNQVFFAKSNGGSAEEIDNVISEAKLRFGKIDAAIHAAYPRSKGWGTKFEEISETHLNEDLSNHLGGAIIFSQRILDFFKMQGYGNLIHISSIMGVANPKFENYEGTSMVSPIEYTAIKSGLIAITKYLAKYYKGNGIRVNCVSPGGILDGQPKLFLEKYRASCNAKGMLDANDITGAILYLLSDASSFMTGQNIIVDDGWSL